MEEYETIEQQWARFLKSVVGDEVDPETHDKMRVLFYGGCISLWTEFMQMARKGDQPLFEKVCKEWEKELAEFPGWMKKRMKEHDERAKQGRAGRP